MRSRRVSVLVLGIIVLSAGDLAVTLAYLKADCMLEANPIAAWIIRSTQSPWALAAFKGCTVATCSALLFRLRRFRCGEVAAWFGIGVLVIMSIMWHRYSRSFEDAHDLLLAQSALIHDEGRLGLP